MKNKSIVFIEAGPSDNPAKMALALRKAGFYTILISLIEERENTLLKKAYDKIISFPGKFFRLKITNIPGIIFYSLKNSSKILQNLYEVSKIKPWIVIGRATPNWLCFIAMKYFKKYPFIYYPYDFRSFCYKDKKDALRQGIGRFEIYSERKCFENADGVMFKGVENKLEMLDEKVFGKKIKINAPILHFFPYCSEELIVPINMDKLSNKDKKIHLVFTGHIGTEPSWINNVKTILDQKIHLHMYGKTIGLTKIASEKREYYKSFFSNPYFHIHPQLPQDALTSEISKYDYGIWMGYYDSNSKSIKYDTGNKFSTYVEAGLPIIYYDNHEYIGQSVQKYAAGIGVNIKTDLKKIIKKQNYRKLTLKLSRRRKEIIMESKVPQIEKFFSEVIAFKKIKENLNA